MRHPHRLPRSPRQAWLALMGTTMIGVALAPAVLAQQPVPAAGGSPIQNGRQQQPSRDTTEERLRQQGDAPPRQRSEQQLQDLNTLSRQLLPPGSEVPAPELERKPPAQR